jgi:hypothetical protein
MCVRLTARLFSSLRPKDPAPKNVEDTLAGIYHIPCKDCSASYIGETQCLDTRLKGHEKAIGTMNVKGSEVAAHVSETGHSWDFTRAQLFWKKVRKYPRWFKEALAIYADPNCLATNTHKGRLRNIAKWLEVLRGQIPIPKAKPIPVWPRPAGEKKVVRKGARNANKKCNNPQHQARYSKLQSYRGPCEYTTLPLQELPLLLCY